MRAVDMVVQNLSRDVQMQFMRPRQLQSAIRSFPVVYVPFGLIEWHGPHLPLGNDALKAHAILVKSAERFGGVVYPPQYLHSGFEAEHLVPVYSDLFQRLRDTGFRVFIGVSGHNVQSQIDMIESSMRPVLADRTCRGRALWEITLSQGEESNTDHAAKWETSNMLYFYPDRVDISELGDGEISNDMSPPWGIGGLDPRKHASAEVGRRSVELAAEAIGREARRLVDSLDPDDQRVVDIAPGSWWMI